MDLRKTIAELYEERVRLDRVIASLELLSQESPMAPVAFPRRGRKFMSPQERRKVSERMRKYWAGRKGEQKPEVRQGLGAISAA
jgi:hypothetical protein